MKANESEKIWINPATDLPKLSGHIDKDSVEYTLEVKDADLEKEIQRQYNVHKNPDNSIVKDCVIMTKDGFEYFAKHFYSLGLKAQKGE